MEKTVILKIKNINENNIRSLREALIKLYGVKEVSQGVKKDSVNLTYDDEFIERAMIELASQKAGFDIKDFRENFEEKNDVKLKREKTYFLISLCITVILFYISFERLFSLHIVLPFFSNPVIFTISTFFLSSIVVAFGFRIYIDGYNAVRKRMPDTDTLISLFVFSSYIFSIYFVYLFFTGSNRKTENMYFLSVSLVITITLLGRYLSLRNKIQTDNTVKRLRSLEPKTANVIRDGKEISIDVKDILIGESVVVRPLEKIPADGIIVKGYTTIDESILTGDNTPVEKQKGSKVIGSSVNKKGYFTFKATKTGENTTLSQIIKLVENARSEKKEIRKLSDTLSYYLIPIILLTAIITSFFWFVFSKNFVLSISAFFSVMIVSCPSSISLAIPLSIISAKKKALKLGIFFKNTDTIQTAYKTNVVMFDKTGTLTEGRSRITDIIAGNENYILSLAAALKRGEEDPLSMAIVSLAYERKIKLPEIRDFHSYPGYGVEAHIGEKKIIVGNKKFMETSKISLSNYEIRSNILINEGKDILYISEENKLVGLITVLDSIKKESFSTIQDLHEMKIKTVMLASENKKTAAVIAKNIGVNEVIADAMPKNKALEIKRFQKEGNIVAMVGDGVNDSPALTQADIGITVGSAKDIAIDSADIVLKKSNIKDIITAIDLSKTAVSNIKQNLFLSFFFNIFSMPIATGLLYIYKDNINYYMINDVILYITENTMLLTPQVALLPMFLSLISIILNALRIRNFKIKSRYI